MHQLLLKPDNSNKYPPPTPSMSPVVSCRPTLADRCAEGAQAAGESLRGSAALPPEGGRARGEAHQGTQPAAPKVKTPPSQSVFSSSRCPNWFLLPRRRWSPSSQS